MNVADQTNNLELALFHVDVLRQFRSLNPFDNLSNILRPKFSSSFTFYYSPPGGNDLAWCIAGDQLRKIIYIDGCVNNTQAIQFIDGYRNGTGPTNTNGFNTWCDRMVNVIMAYAETGAVFQPENLDLVGYSAGGAVANYYVRRLKQNGTLKKLRLITFGAPRALSPTYLTVYENVPRTRWMTDADPIPLVPPRPEDAPALLLALGLVTSIVYSSYVHTSGGISLDVNGIPTDAILPPLSSMSPGLSLATWYFGQEGDPNNPHGLNAYAGRLQKILAAPGHTKQAPDNGAATEPGATSSRRAATRAEAAVETAISSHSAIQNGSGTAIAETVLFKAKKIGKVWCVAFGDRIVVYSGNRKRSFHLARAGNDFLRSMPKQALVDPQGILEQMTDFFNAAVLHGGPSTPPINVGL